MKQLTENKMWSQNQHYRGTVLETQIFGPLTPPNRVDQKFPGGPPKSVSDKVLQEIPVRAKVSEPLAQISRQGTSTLSCRWEGADRSIYTTSLAVTQTRPACSSHWPPKGRGFLKLQQLQLRHGHYKAPLLINAPTHHVS